MKIKINDQVKIIAGKDRGKTGKVIQLFPHEKKIVVEGANITVKHMRRQKGGQKGQKIEFSAPISLPNAMLICPNCGKTTRIGYTLVAAEAGSSVKNKKFRKCKKCGKNISSL